MYRELFVGGVEGSAEAVSSILIRELLLELPKS